MNYPIGLLAQTGYGQGSLFLNIPEYSSFEIGNGRVITMEFIDAAGNELDDPIQIDVTNLPMRAEWFISLIFEGIEDYEPYD